MRIKTLIGFVLAGCLLATSPLHAQDLSSTTCPGSGCAARSVSGQGTIGIQITGTFSGTLQFERTIDGTTWVTLPMTAAGATTTVTSTTTTGVWTGSVAGVSIIRVRFSARASGTATISFQSAVSNNLIGTPNTWSGDQVFNNVTIGGTLNGATVPVSPAVDTVPVITSAATATAEALPNCADSGGNHINYATASHTFSCGTSSGAGATVAQSFTVDSGETVTAGQAVSLNGSNIVVGGPLKFGASLAVLTPTAEAVVDTTHAVLLGGSAATKTAAIFQFDADGTSTAGATQTFTGFSGENPYIFILDTTHVIFLFRDSGNSNRLSAVAGTISGTALTLGSNTQLVTSTNAQNLTFFGVLDATHFVVAYTDSAASNHTTAVVSSVSGTTITAGSASSPVATTNNNTPGLLVLDSTHFVLEYLDTTNSTKLTTIVASISGTTITYGSAITFNNTTGTARQLNLLTSTTFLVTYNDSVGVVVSAVVVSTSDTTQTAGSAVAVGSVASTATSVAVLPMSATVFVVHAINASSQASFTALSIASTTITSGTTATFNNATGTFSGGEDIAAFDATHFGVWGKAGNTGNPLMVATGVLSAGTTITLNNPIIMTGVTGTLAQGPMIGFTTTTTTVNSFFQATVLSPTKIAYRLKDTNKFSLDFLVVFGFDANGNQVIHFADYVNPPNSNGATNTMLFAVATNRMVYGDACCQGTVRQMISRSLSAGWLGVATTSGTAGQSVTVAINGVAASVLSSAAPGDTFYADYDGSISTTLSYNPIGRAISATDLLIDWSRTSRPNR